MNDLKEQHQFIFKIKLKSLETIHSLHILLLRSLVFCQGNILINLSLRFSLSCEHWNWLSITQSSQFKRICTGFTTNVFVKKISFKSWFLWFVFNLLNRHNPSVISISANSGKLILRNLEFYFNQMLTSQFVLHSITYWFLLNTKSHFVVGDGLGLLGKTLTLCSQSSQFR